MQGNKDGPNGSNKSACASCKHQRKKCEKDCALAPYFPAGKEDKFKSVHKIFGVRNVQKMIIRLKNKQASQDQIRMAMESLIWQADMWDTNPFEGCLSEYRSLYAEYAKLHQRLQAYELLHQNCASQFVQSQSQIQQNGVGNTYPTNSASMQQSNGGGVSANGEYYHNYQNSFEAQAFDGVGVVKKSMHNDYKR